VVDRVAVGIGGAEWAKGLQRFVGRPGDVVI
jgi:hypothetical protein